MLFLDLVETVVFILYFRTEEENGDRMWLVWLVSRFPNTAVVCLSGLVNPLL